MTMTEHIKMHRSFCPKQGECIGWGKSGGDACQAFDEMLQAAEKEHTQAAAQKLLHMHAETLLLHGQHVAQGLLLAYKTVAPDPYYKEPQS